jgi:uncharacterized protein (DUF362 family)
MPENVVSIVRYQGIESIRSSVDLCAGLEGIPTGARVLVKPNLVGWDNQGPYPPWGVLTTSLVLEGLCAALKDAGAGEIRIGEGSIKCKHIGSGTKEIYEHLGYEKLVDRYGVRLVDFNEDAFDEVEIETGHTLQVTRHVQECDALLSVPVLKTHGGTVVTLGMKNLKGLLHGKSKQYCHHPDNLLDHFIACIADRFTPSLTLIDGIYAQEQGPQHMGFAHRWDLLIASTDVYAADLLGAHILGYGTDEVKYLNEWAHRHNRSKSVQDLDVRGDVDPDEVRKPLQWDWEWLPDNTGPEAFGKMGIQGLRLPKYEHTLCTGCSYMFNPLMMLLMSTGQTEFDQYEILSGAIMKPSGTANKTFLFGQCQIQANKDEPGAREVIPIKGCPPSMDEMERVLRENGLPVNRKGYLKYRMYLMSRYWKKPERYPLTDFYMGAIPESAMPPPPKPDK